MKRLVSITTYIVALALTQACFDTEHQDAADPASGSSDMPSSDQENGRVQLAQTNTATRAAASDPPRRRYGIGMAPPQGGEKYLTILMVAEGEVAEEAGVLVNDRITHVNGTPVSELSAEEFGSAMRGSPLTLVLNRGDESMTFEMSIDTATSNVTTEPQTVSPEQAAAYKKAAVELADLLKKRYLFEDVGAAYADALRANVEADSYDKIGSRAAFAEQLTAELEAVSKDEHLRVLPFKPSQAQQSGGSDSDPESLGIQESGWLKDKVAFMRITSMPETPKAQTSADAFMREHSDAEALILDVRRCPGGALATMNGFLPYLYDAPTHLLTMEMRPGADQGIEQWLDSMTELHRKKTDGLVERWEHWIQPNENAKPDMPVFVLTDLTASACEHLTAALRASNRATVIGATTRGAGHFVAFHEFGDGYSVVLPVGRTFDPKTGNGWEGVGIEPDIEVDPANAEAEALLVIAGSTL